MRIPRVFHPHDCNAGNSLIIEGQAAHYLVKVLRMSAGRELLLFDGRGFEYSAVIESTTKSTVTVSIDEKIEISRQSPLAINLGIGISRGERFEWVLQKSTELGVSSITPLLTERVEVKLKSDRLEKKLQHWQQIVISACEQCQLNIVPVVNPPVKISDWLATEKSDKKLVLDHRGEAAQLTGEPPQSAAILVGPEGGLTEDEIKLALENDFQSFQLGPRVLRTETAPIAALSVLQFQWGDFG